MERVIESERFIGDMEGLIERVYSSVEAVLSTLRIDGANRVL